jgi:hypothetical protein
MAVLIVNVSLCVFLYVNGLNSRNLIVTIDHNQKSYIACLLAIDEHQPIKPQEQACYNKSP